MKRSQSALIGAAFLMATSAIGPGFITQTTVFTQQLLTSFGFIILCSIILDIAAQLNIWRIVAITRQPASEIANRVFPGMGYVLTLLVSLGGLAFNIGNVAGAGLGMNVMLGMDVLTGAISSALIGIAIFWFKEIGQAMDWFARLLGFVMIGLTLYVAICSHPPVVEAIHHTFLPEKINTLAIITLVGGTVGGYISFAGAHRLLDAGITGKEHIKQVSKSSITAILIASTMRVLLFLAALGVVVKGTLIDQSNPAASIFRSAAGEVGYRMFGVILWAAAITSIVGSAYTSVSFMRMLHPFIERNQRWIITLFIIISTFVFTLVGQPVKVLVIVGTLNGFILPVALALMLLATHKKTMMKDYRYPLWLQIIGWIVVILMTTMAISVITIS